jgi:hypothetical protein
MTSASSFTLSAEESLTGTNCNIPQQAFVHAMQRVAQPDAAQLLAVGSDYLAFQRNRCSVGLPRRSRI